MKKILLAMLMMLAFGLAHNSLAATNVNVTVNWNKYPVKADNFWKNYVNLLASKEIVGIVDKTNLITALNSSIEDVYTVGKIKGGQYAGNFVYVLGFRKQFGSYLFLVMRDKEKFYIIKSYDKEDFYSVLGVYYATQPDAQLIKKAFIVKHNIKLSNYFDHTEKIIVGKFELNKWVVNFIVEPKMDTAKVVKTYNNGNKLKQRADGYYMVDKAGVAYNYVYKLPSQITFSGKTRQKFDYLTPISGCGGNGSVFGTMGISAFSKNDYIIAGKTNNGITVFELKNNKKTTTDLKKVYVQFKQTECGVPEPDEACVKAAELIKESDYAAFVAKHPLIFIQDPFGRYIEFIKEEFYLSGYCG